MEAPSNGLLTQAFVTEELTPQRMENCLTLKYLTTSRIFIQLVLTPGKPLLSLFI